MAPPSAATKDLARFVIHPVILDSATRPTTREERLKTIISNIDRHHAQTHAAIIEDAVQTLQRKRATTSKHSAESSNRNPDAMELDTPDSPTAPSPQHPQFLPQSDLDLLYKNLNEPYTESMGDPGLTAASLGDKPFPPPPADIVQAPSPPEIIAAKTALDRIAAYDRAARQAKFGREHYVAALRRGSNAGTTPSASGGVGSTVISGKSAAVATPPASAAAAPSRDPRPGAAARMAPPPPPPPPALPAAPPMAQMTTASTTTHPPPPPPPPSTTNHKSPACDPRLNTARRSSWDVFPAPGAAAAVATPSALQQPSPSAGTAVAPMANMTATTRPSIAGSRPPPPPRAKSATTISPLDPRWRERG